MSYKEIWDTLSKVDVSDHVEKKMNLSYLSWAWAWGVLMEHYPDAQYTSSTQFDEVSKTCMVVIKVTIGDCHREMWLPVMNHKNQAIINPTSRDTSDALMRCLVKCLAMFGLGHYIYAGEDLPQQDQAAEKEAEERMLDQWRKKFEDCQSLDSLVDVWAQTPKHLKPKLEEAKNAMKDKLQGENQ